MSTEKDNPKDESESEAQPVSGRVLDAFINALALQPGYEEIAARLKSEITIELSVSEAALRRALFSEDGK